MEILLNTIITTYFSSARCINVINNHSHSLNIKLNTPTTVSTFFTNFDHVRIHQCQDFLVYSQRPVTIFKYLEEKIKVHPQRFNQRRYIFASSDNHHLDFFKIFNSTEISFVSNLILVVDLDQTAIGIWTHRYVGFENSNEIYLLDKWFRANQSFMLEQNLFPDKLKNQEGRVLRTAIFSYMPYIIIVPTVFSLEKRDHVKGGYKYRGSEMRLMITIAESMNMTLMPVINENDDWGNVFENGTANGLMGNLMQDNADIGGAALYRWEQPAKYLDLSTITVRSGITCLVPAPKLAAAWQTPIHVYSPQTWIAVMVSFLLCLLTLYSLGCLQLFVNPLIIKERNKMKILIRSLISVAKPFMMQPVTMKEVSKSPLGRYLMGLVFMTALILTTSYDGGLATIMAIPRYEAPINTIQDLLEKDDLLWAATSEGWILSIENSSEPSLRKLVSRFRRIPNETILEQLSWKGQFGFAIERLLNGDYAVGTFIKQDVIQNYHLMTNDFYFELCVLMLRKSSILLPRVDVIILRSFDAGLILFWQNQAALEYMDQSLQKALKYRQKSHELVKLKMLHVEGAFAALILGNTIALVVFVLELLWDKWLEKVRG
ncbi:glutamate receptor ionotropic, kainate 4-like [Euwallacea similis]|uniref:glutamate receptor ionotropic, kainate 4-like n=1 Tax=Euwallacea similis TaxID=1736056 RepID=UPI00344C4DCC